MRPYHRQFKHLDRRTVRITRTLIAGWSAKTDRQRQEAMRLWLDQATTIYQIAPVRLTIGNDDFYAPLDRKITMSKPSVITLLHEFRHHFQAERPTLWSGDVEEDARAWSLSLYHATAPRTLKALAQANRVFHLKPDMTNRSYSWEL